MRIGAVFNRLKPTGISRQLQLVAVVLLLGILAWAAQQLLHARATLLGDTEQQMARLDMVFAEQTGRALETIDLILQSVAEDFRRGAASTSGATDTFSATLARRISVVRQSTGIAVAGRDGRLVYSSDPALLQVVLPPDAKQDIDEAINNPKSGLQITEPFQKRDGSWTALMIRAVPEADGTDRYAAIAFLNLRYFEDFYRAVELTENGAILLHRRDGTVLARFPHDDSIVGKSYANLPPFKDVLARDIAGTLLMDSPMDGNRRVLAIRALKMYPVAVNVSVGEKQVLGLWRHQAWILGISSLVIGVVITWLLLLLASRSHERDQLLHGLRDAKDAAEAVTARMSAEMEERERVEGALRQAQRSEAIGQLTGGVAHDFNNLLSIVMGNIDLLERTLPYDEKTMGRLATMRAAAERGATLTSQLLAFSRRQPLMPRVADLNALVNGLRDLVQSAVGSRVTLQLRLQHELPPGMIDPAQIELVILNLAINARDAMPQGGILAIETAAVDLVQAQGDELAPGSYIALTVRDTGIGMSQQVQAKAFEPFFTTKEAGRGSGLGLSQVYGVARQLGGGVRIESRMAVGTAVHVYLPFAAPNALCLPDRPRREPTAPVSAACVLVVDDDHAVRATTAALLAALGYGVLEAGSGTDALVVLEEEQPIDVLLTDVVMPGMTGPELARRARQQYPNMPVVFISGYSDPDALSGAAGFVHLVRKPARPEDLVEKIESALASESAPVG